MEEKYIIVEYTDIHFMYGKAKGNALEAARLYAEAFPHRRHPYGRTFSRIQQRLRENGSFRHQERPSRPKTLAPDVEERVLEHVAVNPGTSTRRAAMQEGISASSVWRILHHQLLYSYHFQRVQGLKNTDFLPRLTFCQQIQQQSALDRQFLNNVLFTDEAGLTRDGIFNFHNCHVWAAVNPNEVKQARHQQSFSFNYG